MISKKLSIVHCQLSIILAFLPLSVAYAQQDSTLNRTVVVENEYNPNIMDASKINVLPRVEEVLRSCNEERHRICYSLAPCFGLDV